MSWEEDYLMKAVAELTTRVDDIEREVRPARFRQRQEEQAKEAAAETSEETASDVSATNYADMTGAQLSDELGRRNLPKSGTKPEQIARLEADDKGA